MSVVVQYGHRDSAHARVSVLICSAPVTERSLDYHVACTMDSSPELGVIASISSSMVLANTTDI